MTRETIIFLPGFMCDGRLFTPQTGYLSARGFDCRVADLSNAATIERMARQVLQTAPDRFALAGLSMGGIVAFEIVRQAPGRVSHLALLNTTARRDAAGPARKDQMKRVVGGEFSLVLREELKPQYLAPQNRTPEILDVLDRMGQTLGEETFVKQSMALTIRRDAFDVLAGITCPTLILAGEQDRVCPVDRHEEIASRIPRAEFRVLPGCGHISTLEAPEEVNTALLALLTPAPGTDTGAGKGHLRVVADRN
jgi:pimeloyl-ACP methyl ester carboxylesterase